MCFLKVLWFWKHNANVIMCDKKTKDLISCCDYGIKKKFMLTFPKQMNSLQDNKKNSVHRMKENI